MFFDKLTQFFDELNQNIEIDEWYLSDFIDENICPLPSYQAFDILVELMPYLLARDCRDFEYEIRAIIAALKNQADTNQAFWTEMQQNQFNHYFQAA